MMKSVIFGLFLPYIRRFFQFLLQKLLNKMRQNKEINAVHYAVHKHHKQILRSNIEPQMIQQIEVAMNPSQNYRDAFKTVYNDELQKTLIHHQQKKQIQKEKENILNHSSLYGYDSRLLQNSHVSPQYLGQPNKNQGKRLYTDFNEERQARFDKLISRSLNPNTFFKQQDQYCKKQHDSYISVQTGLQNQLRMKEQVKLHEKQYNLREKDVMRDNHTQQMQMQRMRTEVQNQKKKHLTHEIKEQIEVQRQKRDRKSYFKYQNMARHNPITNPIEYHIDNPYILNSYQDKIRHSPHK